MEGDNQIIKYDGFEVDIYHGEKEILKMQRRLELVVTKQAA